MPNLSTANASGLGGAVVNEVGGAVVDDTWSMGMMFDDSDDEVVATDMSSSSICVIGMADGAWLGAGTEDVGVGAVVVVGVAEDVGVRVGEVGVGGGGSGSSLTTAFPSSNKSCAAGGRCG